MPNLTQQRQHPALVALGKAIFDARNQLGYSQEKLALIAGVDRSYVGRVERGDNNVAILTLLKLSQALELSLEELLREAGL
jgi:transcriptional regulator with XRE-family HTH domain